MDADPNNKWSARATTMLLDYYRENKRYFSNPYVRNKLIWEKIVKEMDKNGVKGISELNADRKFRNLKRTFYNIQRKMVEKGQETTTWEYYDEMKLILYETEDIFTTSNDCISSFVTEYENDYQHHPLASSLKDHISYLHKQTETATKSSEISNYSLLMSEETCDDSDSPISLEHYFKKQYKEVLNHENARCDVLYTSRKSLKNKRKESRYSSKKKNNN